MNIVVWFSCGAASAVAAKLTLEKYPNDNVIIVNTPIKEEDSDNLRFKKDVSKWINHPIIDAVAEKYPSGSIVEVFEKTRYMSGVAGATCTKHIKKQARYEFEKTIDIDYHVLGFTFDEIDRHERFVTGERSNTLPILIDAKMTKGKCFEVLINAGVKLPNIYKKGFPNANCIGCVKAQSPTYWNLVRKEYPEVFKSRAEQSRDIGCKLVKLHGDRIFLDELKPTDTGGRMRSIECGIFCDTI